MNRAYKNLVRKILLPMTSCLVLPVTVEASSIDQFGISPGDLATGNARVASPDPATAAYMNPAGLVSDTKSSTVISAYQSTINLKALKSPSEGDAILVVDDSSSQISDPLAGASFGYQTKLPFAGYFGLAGSVPEGFLRMYGASGEDPAYLHYNDRARKPEVYTAVAVPLPYGMSIGVGVYMNLSASGVLQVGLEPDESRGRMELRTEPVVVPYGGVRWRGPKFFEGQVALGLFYRKGHTSDVAIDSDLSAGGDSFRVPASVESNLAAFHDPTIYRAGASYTRGPVAIHSAFELVDWSDYKEPTMVLSGEDITTLTGGNEVTARKPLKAAENIKLGLSYKPAYLLNTTFSTGVEKRGSASKDQANNPYLLDPSRTVLGLGMSLDFSSPLAESSQPDSSFDFGFSYTKIDRITYNLGGGRTGKAGGTVHTAVAGVQRTF